MPTAVFLIGLPGSGKSSSRYLFPNFDIISTDDIVEAYAKKLNSTYSDVWPIAIKSADTEVYTKYGQLVQAKKNILIDRTNLTKKSRARYLNQLPRDYNKVAYVFEVSDEVLKQRLKDRAEATGKIIPQEVIDDMRVTYTAPTIEEGFNAIYRVKELKQLV